MVEKLAKFEFFDFERASNLTSAIESLSNESITNSIDRKLAAAILRIIVETTLSYSSWDSNTAHEHHYLVALWEDMYAAANEALGIESPE